MLHRSRSLSKMDGGEHPTVQGPTNNEGQQEGRVAANVSSPGGAARRRPLRPQDVSEGPRDYSCNFSSKSITGSAPAPPECDRIPAFFYKFSSNVCLGGFVGSEPSLSIACCAGPDPTTRSRNSSAMAEFYPNV